ncbi:MAG: SlyX family protein [Micavibrio sp.]|nr:SlyX family protein [Micavibrio sp.]
MHETRVINVESTLAHLEHKVEELSQLAFEQGRVIECLEAKLGRMQNKVSEIEDLNKDRDGQGLSPTEFAAENKPPHY